MTVTEAIRRAAVHARRAGMIVIAILAASIVTSLTVDLGPALRARAEAAASARILRTVTIGSLSVRLFDGRFVARDLVIAGYEPASEPFLRAAEIRVLMPLAALLRREILVTGIEMTGWRMLIETFPGGRHNVPRFASGSPSSGPGLFSTTIRYVRASRGHFTYEDHGTPWSTVLPDLDITVMKLAGYRGFTTSSGGVVRIQDYEPMPGSLRTWFRIDGGRIVFERIELDAYGSESICTGEVDLAHWPEQTYRIESRIQLPRMREVFWAHDTFSLSGEALFTGTFHIYKGGRELKGDFRGANPGYNTLRFPDTHGSLVWTHLRFDVTRARSAFYGGTSDMTYALAPLDGSAPTGATWDFAWTDVDLTEFSDAMAFRGIRLAGRATGRNHVEWPLGRWSDHHGHGRIATAPSPGVGLQGRDLPARIPDPSIAHVFGDPFPPLPPVPVGGEVTYEFGPEWLDFAPSRLASPTTFVEFHGRTAWGERSVIPFRVVSTDWQESDRILAGIMTAFGTPTLPVEVGGGGTFDGVLLNRIARPRIEGRVTGQRMRGWDVEWGAGEARIVVENSYVDVTDAVLRRDGGEIRTSGRFSLGFPRPDKGEEMNARITCEEWPLEDFRHAFLLDEFPVFGKVAGEIRLYGDYLGPYGFGRGTITDMVAYDEKYEHATSALRFIGTGVWLDGYEVRKGSTGIVRGSARVDWLGTYAFNADARAIPVEAVQMLTFPQAPLTGSIDFTADGSGTFLEPQYEVKGRIRDLFVQDEGIGQLTGRFVMRGDDMSFEFEGASPRLAVSGTGRIELLGGYAGDMQFRFTDTSLDPYLRVFAPELSPFVTAVGSGTLQASGSFASLDGIAARARFDRLDMHLFDYGLRNDGVIDVGLDQSVLRLHALRFAGEDTKLALSGNVDLGAAQVAVRADGHANLGVAQAFFRDLRSAGRAVVAAEFTGPLERPSIAGSAVITDGRVRQMYMPHAIEAINGRLAFAGRTIRFDDITARIGRGDVRFGGVVGLEGFLPSTLDLTASGVGMELRYPEGFRSLLDADLALRGTLSAPVLSGTVHVRGASLKRRFDLGSGMIELGGSAAAGGPGGSTGPSGFPLRFDVRILAPSSLEIDNNVARITSSADLTLRGTYDRPLLFGRAEVDRGEVWFEGKRYVVTRGNIDFANPTRIEPSFDIEAETRARAPGQTYRVTLRAQGTMQRINFDVSSDPPLPQVDILTLLLGDAGSTQDAELRALQQPNTAETTLLGSRAARLLASPIASNVGRVVEQTFGVDTFQITPLWTDPFQQTGRFTPGARLTIGKRISDRVYLTYSRSLTSSARDQVILLEYDQNDRLSWVVTQNEDRTYALDVRVRHVF